MRFFLDLKILLNIPSEQVQTIGIQASSADFRRRFSALLTGCAQDPYSKLISCVINGFSDNPHKLNLLFMLVRPDPLVERSAFFKEEEISPLDSIKIFIEKHCDANQLQLSFYFSITLDFSPAKLLPDIHLDLCIVLPEYTQKGVMKTVLLSLLMTLQQAYFDRQFNVSATVIHPATYLFFYPEDKCVLELFYSDLSDESRPMTSLFAAHAKKGNALANAFFSQQSFFQKIVETRASDAKHHITSVVQ